MTSEPMHSPPTPTTSSTPTEIDTEELTPNPSSNAHPPPSPNQPSYLSHLISLPHSYILTALILIPTIALTIPLWALHSGTQSILNTLTTTNHLLLLKPQMKLVHFCPNLSPAQACSDEKCTEISAHSVNDCGKVVDVTHVSNLIAMFTDAAALSSIPAQASVRTTTATATVTITTTTTVMAPTETVTERAVLNGVPGSEFWSELCLMVIMGSAALIMPLTLGFVVFQGVKLVLGRE